jgi:uncharacterized protein
MSLFFKNHELLEDIMSQFLIDINGDHGLQHWERVFQNTQLLSNYYGIESDVFELFAMLHDSKRENEFSDIGHGSRAAIFAKELISTKKINISKEDQRRLLYACSNHTISNQNAKLYSDLVVQICFDADRLDIGRVGITPQEDYFQTEYAKKLVRKKCYSLNFGSDSYGKEE